MRDMLLIKEFFFRGGVVVPFNCRAVGDTPIEILAGRVLIEVSSRALDNSRGPTVTFPTFCIF